MKKVSREQVLSPEQYAAQRETLRQQVLALKRPRRVHVGKYLTFLFETSETVLYQVQEMLRVEGRSGEQDVVHELQTYNELLAGDGELSCTLLIEIDDPLQRDIVLRKWVHLPAHIYLKDDAGTRTKAVFDARQIGDERLSSVQYLKFPCGGCPPVAIGLDHPDLEIEISLDEAQRAAMAQDIAR